MKNIFWIIVILFSLVSCARVGSPIGGSKDTIPPHFIGSNIDSPRVRIPVDIRQLRIDFDEYVTLKDIRKNLIVSPPIKKIKKILPSNLASKFVLIQWEDTLKANTTYNFNFGNSIVDNNEGNPLRYFNFAFSTGDTIDGYYVSGTAKEMIKSGKETEKNIVVGLYQAKDSVDFHQKPYYITKADDDGYYELNYLAPGKYRAVAFSDENGNSVFDSGKEAIAFSKEDVVVDKNISGLNFKLYPSKKKENFVEGKTVPGGFLLLFEGHPADPEIKFQNEKLTDFKILHRKNSDSAIVLFDAKKLNIGTDAPENLKFTYKTNTVKTSSVSYRYNAKDQLEIHNDGDGTLAPQENLKISANMPLAVIQPEKWTLKTDSATVKFTAEISKENMSEIIVKGDFLEGKKYQLTVPRTTVQSYFMNLEKSKRFDFEIAKSENFGTLHFTLQNKPEAKFWFQLLQNDEVKYEKYSSADKIDFTNIKPGNYIARILTDNNGNGIWDETDFEKGAQAEDVYIFYKYVAARPMWEVNETWDLNDKRELDTSKVPQDVLPKKSSSSETSKDGTFRLDNVK